MRALSRPLTSMLALWCLSGLAVGQETIIVEDDFESYADSAALFSVWGPSSLDGQLVDETFTEDDTLFFDIFPDEPEPVAVGAQAFPEGGQGVEHFGGSVLEYQLPINGGSPLVPTATESVVLQGDIFDIGALGNKRMSIGLRSSVPDNIVEIGHWNASTTEFAGRAILFAEPSPVSEQPNWQFYELPIELDRPDDADDITTLADIGQAWHTHRATIGPDSILYEIDLFRDGTFDASMEFAVTPTTAGFDVLRIGGPSGVSSQGNGTYGGVIFDNIKLSLVDVPEMLVGDYNSDGSVDAADYVVYRNTLGDSVDVGTGADGNENGVVDPGDLTAWADNYGASSTPSAAVAVPEPIAGALAALAVAGALTRRRG